MRQVKKVSQLGSNSPWYSNTRKSEKFLNEKKCKNNKTSTCFKGFASSYDIEILNSFDPELHLKDTESAIKTELKKIIGQNWRF